MEGLKRLVDLYGGLESLQSEPLILNKIYRLVKTRYTHQARPLTFPGVAQISTVHSTLEAILTFTKHARYYLSLITESRF